MHSNERELVIHVDETGNPTDKIHEIWGQTRSFVQGSTLTSKSPFAAFSARSYSGGACVQQKVTASANPQIHSLNWMMPRKRMFRRFTLFCDHHFWVVPAVTQTHMFCAIHLCARRTLPGVWNLVTAGFFEMSLFSVRTQWLE
eukprot:1178964-Prorocentrum_minimum.AAC.4